MRETGGKRQGCMMHVSRGSFPGLWFGNLNNRSNAGLRYVNANNSLSNTRWNILLRHSNVIKLSIFLHHAILAKAKIDQDGTLIQLCPVTRRKLPWGRAGRACAWG